MHVNKHTGAAHTNGLPRGQKGLTLHFVLNFNWYNIILWISLCAFKQVLNRHILLNDRCSLPGPLLFCFLCKCEKKLLSSVFLFIMKEKHPTAKLIKVRTFRIRQTCHWCWFFLSAFVIWNHPAEKASWVPIDLYSGVPTNWKRFFWLKAASPNAHLTLVYARSSFSFNTINTSNTFLYFFLSSASIFAVATKQIVLSALWLWLIK